MTEEDFQTLCESVRQAGEIRAGRRHPSRVFAYRDPDAKEIRKRLGLSQSRFAALLGVSVGTLRDWEQGRERP